MAEVTAEAPPKKTSKALLIGLVLAPILGAGGYFGVQKGLIPELSLGHGEADAGHGESDELVPGGDVEFVPVEPIIVTLTGSERYEHLRFASQIEVPHGKAEEVASLMPRVVDAMNSYLRAINARDLEEDGALLRLRSQLLRRVQLVVGESNASNLLVMEFVLN